MSDDLLQDERVAALKTPLGKNKLALSRFEGQEGLSELFEYRVDALSRDPDVDFNELLGRTCTVSVALYKEPRRYFDGLVVEAQTMGMVHDLYSYRFILRPTLWLLSRTTNCRIWHDKGAIDIVKEVLSDRGVDYRSATTRSFRTREYCVQYRETDLAFVCRLMEEEGVYYFFEHKDSKHTMVLADSPSSHQPISGHDTLRFTTATAMGHVHEEALTEWTAERRFRSGKFELRDYNFKTPNNKLIGPAKASATYDKSDMEIYDYPGKYDQESEGKSYAEVRRDAEQAWDYRRYGAGEAASLCPGGLVTLKEHPKGSENQRYLILRATHDFSAQLYRSSLKGDDGEQRYRGSYEFAPADRVFRAPLVTPKPLVHGPQTAKVVQRPGGAGEEIDVDEHGRIRVRFHWDRDDKRSCWVRVAQLWSGPKWGGQFIPRVDMEVVVEFLEGDPDRPLVVGCVYNADNKYPWSLPDNKTQSGIKSDSSKGHNGYNQIRFEDKKMSEQIEVHAEKDLDSTILHAETRKIGERFEKGPGSPSRETTLVIGDDKLTVQAGNRETMISMDDKLTVMMNKTSTVLMNHSTTVALNQSETIGVSDSTTVGATQSTTVGAARSATVGGADSHTAGGAVSITAGGAIATTAGAAMSITAGGAVTITAPVVKITGVLILTGPPIISPV
jgi:type VI secretion system secreted protein VgrG